MGNKNSGGRLNRNFHWKGSKATYRAKHQWLIRNFGKASKCENPKCEDKSIVFQWAKLKGKRYIHKRENFFMLCGSCHVAYDKRGFKKNYKPWNKGLTGVRCGVSKGNIPWNKGIKQLTN